MCNANYDTWQEYMGNSSIMNIILNKMPDKQILNIHVLIYMLEIYSMLSVDVTPKGTCL